MTWEFGRFLYLSYLWDVAPRSYFESLQRRRLSVIQTNVNNAIDIEIQETQRQFGTFFFGKSINNSMLTRMKSDAARWEF